MRVWVLGCRGSTPTPGPATVRYGGNTSALALAADDGAPTLLLDAGTGLVNLAQVLGEQPFEGALLLSHLHWDHTQGLPFSPATDHESASVVLSMPAQDAPADKALAWAMSPPHFPIGPDGLRGAWSFDGIEEGRFEAGGFEVLARAIPHKGGRTFGYRVVAHDGRSLAYMPDHHPAALGSGPDGFGPYHEAARALAGGVDLLVHDTQYTAEEFPASRHFGHSAIDYAVGLARVAGVGRLLGFHHNPRRTDDALDELAARFASEASFAREGDSLAV